MWQSREGMTMIQVLIRPQFRGQVSAGLFRQAAGTVLEIESAPADASLTVVVTGNREIQALNEKYRGVDAPTDVLSFGQEPTEHVFVTPQEEPPYLGDVVLSLPRAQEQAIDQGHGTESELELLTVHGVLHLLGYDHTTPEEEALMWARQDAALAALGKKRDG
ncbi:MAG: rRNA maturation RNase YbeY [Anaerolineae bacterium]|nr:rRNA maturation RNase YbeY [Anaerolineae bacterium]